MDNKLVAISIAAVIGIIVLGSVLMPILGNATDTEATIVNKGARYSVWDSGSGAHTITFTSTSMITDGVNEQPLPDNSVYGATLAFGTNGIVRLDTSNGVSWWGSISGQGTSRYMGVVSSVTITIGEDGASTVSAGGTTRNIGTAIMFPDPNGDYALSYNPYVVEDSVMYGAGTTTVEGTSYGINWTGTVDEITVNPMVPPIQSFGDVVVNTKNVTTNLLKVNSVVIPNTTADADLTYTYFFAPQEITYNNPGYVGSNGANIIAAIPTLIIVGILVMIVALVIRSRSD